MGANRAIASSCARNWRREESAVGCCRSSCLERAGRVRASSF